MTPLFRSFWQAGFESACHINRAGVRLDLVAATQHDLHADEDYARLRAFGIGTVRESMRWPLIDRAGRYDFSSARLLAEAARRRRTQIVWTLCHFGWPDDVDLLAPAFVDRFARYCGAAARFLVEHGDAAPRLAPMNEISFLSWAIGHAGYIRPAAIGHAARVKAQLVRATIAGIEAIWDVSPAARVIHIDPLMHVVAPRGGPHGSTAAAVEREAQFEAWEMLRGQAAPELGGHPRYLDVVGVNFYHANQREWNGDRLRWEDEPRDERWRALHLLLEDVWRRFGRPVYLAETSHFGSGRARWILETAAEVAAACDRGVAVAGLCVYPIIDRPDWDAAGHWHHSGLWDLHRLPDGRLERVVCQEYASALRQAQAQIAHHGECGVGRETQAAGLR